MDPARTAAVERMAAFPARHSTYGVLDVMALVRLAVDHDAEHLAGLAPGRESASARPAQT
jgi:hypothetical protein